MELLQIIIFSIKIFALISTLIVITSYLIYKLKNRKVKKTYSNVPVQMPSIKPYIAEKPFNPEQYENIQNLNEQMINVPVKNEQIIYEPIESPQMIKPADESQQIIYAPIEMQQMNNLPIENQQYDNLQYKNTQYQNIQYGNQPMVGNQSHQPGSFGQRFKILNEDYNSMAQRKSILERLQPVTIASQNFNAPKQSQVFNMYDYYSSSNFEPMHKIKLY
jgi:hypothetical protein